MEAPGAEGRWLGVTDLAATRAAPSPPAPQRSPCPWGVLAKDKCLLLLSPEVESDPRVRTCRGKTRAV